MIHKILNTSNKPVKITIYNIATILENNGFKRKSKKDGIVVYEHNNFFIEFEYVKDSAPDGSFHGAVSKYSINDELETNEFNVFLAALEKKCIALFGKSL